MGSGLGRVGRVGKRTCDAAASRVYYICFVVVTAAAVGLDRDQVTV